MKYPSNTLQIIVITTVLFMSVIWAQQVRAFDSGSDGSDGALDFSWVQDAAWNNVKTVIFDPSNPNTFDPNNPDRRLDQDNDNVFHFTTIKIPQGVQVKLRANKLNWAPVYWLATGDVLIESWAYLNLNGNIGHGYQSQNEAHSSAMPGPGGFSGGYGASGLNLAQPGFGPGAGKPSTADADGGGASHAWWGAAGNGITGDRYGSPFLLPIIGGSGGAGGGDANTSRSSTRGGGGAGGGAIVISSNTKITIDGAIVAQGGGGGGYSAVSGGGGSGGAIRLLTPKFFGRTYNSGYSGTGYITVTGGAQGWNGGNAGGAGRIRIETTLNRFSGNYYPDATANTRIAGLVDSTPFLPTDTRIPKWPSVYVVSINAIDLPAEPTASFAIPDSTIDTDVAVPVVFKTNHIPTDAAINLKIVSSDFGVIDVAPSFDSGDQADATWLANVAFPAGFSRGYVQAVWTP